MNDKIDLKLAVAWIVIVLWLCLIGFALFLIWPIVLAVVAVGFVAGVSCWAYDEVNK